MHVNMCEKKVVLKIAVQTFEDGDFFTFSSDFGVFETHFRKKHFLKKKRALFQSGCLQTRF